MPTDARNNPIYETAKRCPRCEIPGERTSSYREKRPTRGMATIEVYVCRNERCVKFEGNWIVQLNDDGTIPERKKGEKEFPMPQRLLSMGEQYMEMLQEEERRGETFGGL